MTAETTHTSPVINGISGSPEGTDNATTVPGLSPEDGHDVALVLQMRIHALNDLQLVLKHIHWNVVGPQFIGVHTMLDPQIDGVRAMVDVLAERMATLGASPRGTPGALVDARTWDDYALGRDDTRAHLGALDLVYNGVIRDHRAAFTRVSEADPVTEDILIGQTGELEQYQWFVRAHLQNAAGQLSTEGAATEQEAAEAATHR
ncbi:MAG: Dps family protein [Actinomycetota bacterium]